MQIQDYGSARLKNRNAAFGIYAETVLGYLRKKYGTDFEIVGLIGQSLGIPYDRWGVRPRSGGEAFSAFGCLTAEGYVLRDSYIPLSKKNACEEKLKGIIGINNSVLKPGIEICEEHCREGCFNSKIMLLIKQTPETEAEHIQLVEGICDKISAAGFMTMINWFVVSPGIFERANGADLLSCAGEFRLNAYRAGTAYVNREGKISVEAEQTNVEKNLFAPLKEAQLERLCTIVYLDGVIENRRMENLGAILRYVKEFEFYDGIYYPGNYLFKDYPCEMTCSEWLEVINDVLADAALCSLRVVKSIDVTEKNADQYGNILPGHRVICFLDDARSAYIIFRGTSGDYEWYDNAEGMVLSDTAQQLAARQFVTEVKEDKELNVSRITVAGHSKGGNKAQYAAVTVPAGYVDRCVSIDGQGFSEQFFRVYKREIIDRKGSVYLMAERRDFVNCLGLRLYDARFYVGRRGEPEAGRDYGDPLPFFHCPDALRNDGGELGDNSPEGNISKVINELTAYFLTDEEYRLSRYNIAVDVIALMMKNKKSTSEETAEALKNLTEVCFRLISKRRSFWENITGLVYSETDVLLATLQMMENESGSNNKTAPGDGVRALYIQKLKKEIIGNGEFRKNFITVLLYVIQLLKKMLADKSSPQIKRLTEYIIDFIGEMQEAFIKKTTERIVSEVFGLIKEVWDKFTAVFVKRK